MTRLSYYDAPADRIELGAFLALTEELREARRRSTPTQAVALCKAIAGLLVTNGARKSLCASIDLILFEPNIDSLLSKEDPLAYLDVGGPLASGSVPSGGPFRAKKGPYKLAGGNQSVHGDLNCPNVAVTHIAKNRGDHRVFETRRESPIWQNVPRTPPTGVERGPPPRFNCQRSI